MKRMLLTFTGFHDPYSKGLVGDEDIPGPILSLVNASQFNHIILFATPSTQAITDETRRHIEAALPETVVEVRDVPLDDPTDYSQILKGLRRHLTDIQEDHKDVEYYVAVASGTPHMHACWVLLAAAGEIPARILQIRPPRFVTKERPLVSEVDLSGDDFPAVRARITGFGGSDDGFPDLAAAIQRLGIIADHASMRAVLDSVAALAQSAAPILIRGETGTGKEILARLVHVLSGRPAGSFVAVNCAALPAELVESILFGHCKGAFTGATKDQQGKFDRADGGTLFLDELGDLPVSVQAKLLRVLQDGLVEPVGSAAPHAVDVRIVAATNRNIARQIRAGHFREDLYYRLNVGEIILPPLRDRRSDVPKLALRVLDRVNATVRTPKRLTQEALTRLQNHSWPGNVRDLENVIERSVRLCRGTVLDADDLLITEPIAHADPLEALPEPSYGFSLDSFLGGARRQLILRAIETARGNQSEAARLLGITPQAVSKFMRQESNYNQG